MLPTPKNAFSRYAMLCWLLEKFVPKAWDTCTTNMCAYLKERVTYHFAEAALNKNYLIRLTQKMVTSEWKKLGAIHYSGRTGGDGCFASFRYQVTCASNASSREKFPDNRLTEWILPLSENNLDRSSYSLMEPLVPAEHKDPESRDESNIMAHEYLIEQDILGVLFIF